MGNTALIRLAREKFAADFEGGKPLHAGVADGVCWVTAKSPVVGVNGYALVPAEGHPWSNGWPLDEGWEPDDVLDVHGGVTCSWHPWIGFDTAHAWDWWPPEYDELRMSGRFLIQDGCTRWSPALVAYEARKLAIQVARIGFEARRKSELSEPSRFRHLDVAECNTPEGRREREVSTPLPPEKLREMATKHRRAMLRLHATDADFIACGVDVPTEQERAEIAAEFTEPEVEK